MKKLLSVILAGALALTAVSPAFAAKDGYVATENIYCDVDFDAVKDLAEDSDLSSFLSEASNGEFGWNANGAAGAAITKATDPVMGTVAKIKPGTSGTAQFKLLKGAWKNGAADTTNKKGNILEFNFKVTNPNSSVTLSSSTEMKSGFTFNSDGTVTISNKAPNAPTKAYKAGVWNHCVVEILPMYFRNGGFMGGTKTSDIHVWVNGVELGWAGADAGYAAFNAESWTDTYFAINADSTGNSEILIANLEKYDGTDSVRYSPADAGNALAEITSSDANVTVNADTNMINYNRDVVTTIQDVVDALAVSNNGTIAVHADLGSGAEKIPADYYVADFATIPVTWIVAESEAGGVLNYYSIAPMEAVVFEENDPDDLITVDDDTETISGDESQIATLGVLKGLFTLLEGTTVSFTDAVGTAITDDNADVSTVKKAVFASVSGTSTKTYTVDIRAASEVYFDNKAKGSSSPSGEATWLPMKTSNYFGSRATNTAVSDDDLGYNVLRTEGKGTSGWIGWYNDNAAWTGGDLDVQVGDKIIFETTIKPEQENAPYMPLLEIFKGASSKVDYNSAKNIPFDFGSSAASARSVIYTPNDHSVGFPYRAGDWYHIVNEYTVTASGSTVNTWINGVSVGDPVNLSISIAEWTTLLSTKENVRLKSPDGVNKTAFRLAKFAIYRDNNGYNAVEQEDDVALTTSDELIQIDPRNAKINIMDTSLTVGGLNAKLTRGGNVQTRYFNASNEEVAQDAYDTTPVTDVKYIRLRSMSGECVVKYYTSFDNLVSDTYVVDTVNKTISGVKQFTTVESFLDKIITPGTYGVDYMFDQEYKYIEDGAMFVRVDTGDMYTIELVEGTLGSEVAADGKTLVANVGMVDDAKTPAIFVAGVNDGAFSNIVKITKAAGADTIKYDLSGIGATSAKVYIWDSLLTSLAEVAEYECVEGVWSAK